MWVILPLLILVLLYNNVTVAKKWVTYDSLIWYGSYSREHDRLSPEQLKVHIMVSTFVVGVVATVVGIWAALLGIGVAVITSSALAALGSLAVAVLAGYVVCLVAAYGIYYLVYWFFCFIFFLFNK